jgi:hypothetical protein
MLDYNFEELEELEKLATIYKLKIKQLSENLFIQSKYDEWYISDNGYVISLYHRNKKFQLKHYHLQRKFMNNISFEF